MLMDATARRPDHPNITCLLLSVPTQTASSMPLGGRRKGDPMVEMKVATKAETKAEKKPRVCTLCGIKLQYPICDDCSAKEQRRALVRKEKEEHIAS